MEDRGRVLAEGDPPSLGDTYRLAYVHGAVCGVLEQADGAPAAVAPDGVDVRWSVKPHRERELLAGAHLLARQDRAGGDGAGDASLDLDRHMERPLRARRTGRLRTRRRRRGAAQPEEGRETKHREGMAHGELCINGVAA
jgi:hypothetical protein